jgi:DNA mismatch repair ATPase MutS
MDPQQYYTQRINHLNKELNLLNRYFKFTYPARLLTFVAMAAMGFWFVKSKFNDTFLWFSLLFLILFIVSVIWDLQLVRRQKVLKARLKVNEDEVKYLDYNYDGFDDGSDLATLDSKLSNDFDLFGRGSLFQFLNRSVTREGRDAFAGKLVSWSTDIGVIRNRQSAVKELSNNLQFIEDFRSLGILTDIEKYEIQKLKKWLESPSLKITSAKWTARIWPFFLAAWIVATIIGITGPNLLFIPIMGALLIVGSKSKTTQNAHEQLGKVARTLKKYSGLIELTENKEFSSEYLKALQQKLSGNGKKAGKALKILFSLLEKFDYRLNFITAVLFNILFLFDFHILAALEKWKANHKNNVPKWFDAIAGLDTLTGFAVFAFNNSGRTTFPDPDNDAFNFNAKGLKHPLIPHSDSVENDIEFSGQPKVLVITGANMAGKSTFLRTLTVNLILGMCGAPVCARKMSFSPCDIRSSINIRDSLANHESYFYAELQRLKSIVTYAEQNPMTFVVLDEILRGTNSLDKHNGSLGLLKNLIGLNAVVVIATHDLGIGRLEQDYPGIATNYCFEVELEGNQLAFDYKLKPGVSQKLNASFLMKKMGLVH